MSRPTRDERLASIHAEAIQDFDEIQSALRDERLQCLQDRRFYSIAGAQWEGPLADQFENKPKLEVNKIHLAVIRIINEYRNNRITVNFVPKTGVSDDALSDTCNGLYRADEQDSGAEEAYDNAFEEAVGGGFGAWRLRACYEDDEIDESDDEPQRIRIEPIFDADSSVFFDLGAKRQDKKDAKRCYVITSMYHSAYKEEYGDDPASWPKVVRQNEFDWFTPNVVYIAEYYRVEEKKDLIRIFRGLDGQEESHRDVDLQDDQELADQLSATGFREVRQKKIKRKQVHKYIMSGNSILEDCGVIAGQNIPIVPVYGKRWFVDNVERCMGHVRLAKDVQRLKNMQLSKLAEVSALSTVEKPIMTPEEIAGHGVMWAEDNIKNYPYLLKNRATDINGTPILAPMEYTRVPNIPPAMAALLQITEQDMQDLLGNQQAGEQLHANVSAEAVDLVQNKLDMQTFIYMSNMSKAVKRCGEIWLSMAKDILVQEGRKMKAIDQSGEVGSVELMRPVLNKETGEAEIENDVSKAQLDVSVEVGPSSSSKRSATVKSLTGMMSISQDPDTLQVLGAMAMMNMEGEGISDVRDYFRQKLIRLGVVKPTEEEQRRLQEEAANRQPDPQSQFLKASAEQAQADAVKARADTVLTLQKAKESEAKTEQILTDIGHSTQDQFIKTVNEVHGTYADNKAPTAPSQ